MIFSFDFSFVVLKYSEYFKYFLFIYMYIQFMYLLTYIFIHLYNNLHIYSFIS